MKEPVVVRSGEGEKLMVTGAEVRLLCEAGKTGGAWSVSECDVPENSGPPPHQHPWDEAYYVMDGKVRFKVGEKDVVAEKGDFVYVPGGTVHGFQGADKQTARVLFFDAPAHAGNFFREVAREVTDFPRDAYKMGEIGARYGIDFIH